MLFCGGLDDPLQGSAFLKTFLFYKLVSLENDKLNFKIFCWHKSKRGKKLPSYRSQEKKINLLTAKNKQQNPQLWFFLACWGTQNPYLWLNVCTSQNVSTSATQACTPLWSHQHQMNWLGSEETKSWADWGVFSRCSARCSMDAGAHRGGSFHFRPICKLLYSGIKMKAQWKWKYSMKTLCGGCCNVSY